MTAVVITGSGLVRETAPPDAGPGAWFDPVPLLGRRGWKYLTLATRYLLGATHLAVNDAGLDPAGFPDESMGVVVGTNFAALPVFSRITRIVVSEGPEMISPAEAPNFSVNIPASTISMRYGMRAFNITLTNPMVAGLESVLTLSMAIRQRRARLGVAGATEERPDNRRIYEGACCFVMEPVDEVTRREAVAKATVAGGWCRFSPPGNGLRALRDPLSRLIGQSGDDVCYAVAADGDIDSRLDELCQQTADRMGIRMRRMGEVDGRYVSVSPMLHLAEQIAAGQHGLVLAASGHGHVAALRLTR
ncbi:MAG TPA: beta-ketoacyl synthase N-terminal-like domain-containing protein [Candidatus Limnocylindrales bacterium]|nr:beta-ketoacyl synthase N-terminal-like domain-containing protein [Candidatus Limnocylindrales bacterium]